jgi:hypothetical protein
MATFVKVNDFVHHLGEGGHNFAAAGGDQYQVALSNTAPGSESSNPLLDGDGVLANVSQIAYTNLSTQNLVINTSTVSSGTWTINFTDLVLSATGAVATFQYVYVFNQDMLTTPATDGLVCHFDYGSPLTLADGESLTIDFESDGSGNGDLFTLA